MSPAHDPVVRAAQETADTLGIPLHVINAEEEFSQTVIKHFCREYQNGRTPNPCILCNPLIKFRLIVEKADELGFSYIATGHYADLKTLENGRIAICKASCLKRDQSYMLYRLTQYQLSKLLLPLSHLEKSQSRPVFPLLRLQIAKKTVLFQIMTMQPILKPMTALESRVIFSPQKEKSWLHTKGFPIIQWDSENVWALHLENLFLSNPLMHNPGISSLPGAGMNMLRAYCSQKWYISRLRHSRAPFLARSKSVPWPRMLPRRSFHWRMAAQRYSLNSLSAHPLQDSPAYAMTGLE